MTPTEVLLAILVAALVVAFLLLLSLEGMQRIYRTYRDADEITQARAREDERAARAALYGRRKR